MNKVLLLASVLFLLLSSVAVAATTVTSAKVLYTGTYTDGGFFVALDKTIAEPGCVSTRFDVAAGHPQIKTWLSIAMAAAISGKTVSVTVNGCVTIGPAAIFPTMNTTGNDTWFMLGNP